MSSPAESRKVREGRRMASSLRRQVHDETHQRITEQVRPRRRTPTGVRPGVRPPAGTLNDYSRAAL